MTNVTVLMPVKNGQVFLPKTIDCIEKNVSEEDEIIVVDDASSDSTPELLMSWSKNNSKVRVLQNREGGLVSALNLGLNEASNNWIARFDVDDTYRFDRLRRQRELISDEVVAIFCDYEFFSESNRSLGVIPSSVFNQATKLSLYRSQQTPHPGSLFNRDAVKISGGYRSEDFPAEDISLWLRLAKVGELVSVPAALFNYRLSKNSVSGQKRREAKMLTYSLISKIGIDRANLSWCFDAWLEVYSQYLTLPMGTERAILYYRNLKCAAEFQGASASQMNQLASIRNHLLRDSSLSKGLLNLLIGKVKRETSRRF